MAGSKRLHAPGLSESQPSSVTSPERDVVGEQERPRSQKNEREGLPPNSSFQNNDTLVIDAVPRLCTNLPEPGALREYDIARAWPLPFLQAHGRDGEGRFLIYAREGESLRSLRDTLQAEVKALSETEALFLRLDQVRLLSGTVHELVAALFRDPSGKRFSKGKPVVLVNPDSDTRQSLYDALAAANDFGMVLEARDVETPATWQLWYVGSLQPNLKVMLDHIRSHEPITSLDIATSDELVKAKGRGRAEVTDAPRRIAALYENGTIIRKKEEGSSVGRPLFSYSYFHPTRLFLHKISPGALTYRLYNPRLSAEAMATFQAAYSALKKGDKPPEVEKLGERGRKLYALLNDRAGVASCLWVMGNAVRSLELYDKALEYHQSSLAIRETLDDPKSLGDSLHSLGLVYAERSNTPEDNQTALSYYRDALRLRRQIGDRLGESTTLNNMANLYSSMQLYANAWSYCKAALAIRIELGTKEYIASSLGSLAYFAEHFVDWRRVAVFNAASVRLQAEADLRFQAIGQKAVKERFDKAAAHLSPEEIEAAKQDGRTMTLEDLLAYAEQLNPTA